jgi:carbon monoxide dehydrogenase subunit G
MAIELDNSFTVPVPPEQAWDVLLDVERIAPCMPGASVTAVNGDEIEGQVKVKLGPLALTYKGTAKFTDKDEANRTISIDASGKETRGAGTASATVQAVLRPAEAAGSTLVSIHTSLNVTGRPAQFGRSLLPEVSGKLIGQFATNLEALIAADKPGAAAPAAAAASLAAAGAGPADAGTIDSGTAEAGATGTPAGPAPAAPVIKQEESLDAVKFVVIPVLKRVVPVAVAGAVLAFVVRRLTRRKPA